MGALSSCGAWAVQHGGVSCCRARALVAWVLERGLRTGTWAQVLHSLWDLPWPGIEPGSPALVGGFLTTRPPGKPCMCPHTLEGTLRAWPSPQGSSTVHSPPQHIFHQADPNILFYFVYILIKNNFFLSIPHSMQVLVPQPGVEPEPPAVEAWSLNCWTTRGVP